MTVFSQTGEFHPLFLSMLKWVSSRNGLSTLFGQSSVTCRKINVVHFRSCREHLAASGKECREVPTEDEDENVELSRLGFSLMGRCNSSKWHLNMAARQPHRGAAVNCWVNVTLRGHNVPFIDSKGTASL